MMTAAKIAGYFAAHAIWGVSENPMLTPMLAYITEDGERKMERFVGEDAAATVAQVQQKLERNDMDADDACLLYDGRIPLGQEKSDAIIIEMRAYFSPHSEAIIAVPYTPATPGKLPFRKPQPFRVHKPKLIAWENCEDFDINAVFQAFFEGVDGHKQGSKVWNDCLDESK